MIIKNCKLNNKKFKNFKKQKIFKNKQNAFKIINIKKKLKQFFNKKIYQKN